MPVPSTRTPVRVARGTYTNLSTVDALASLQEGEICFATDEQKLYVKQGGGLTAISAASAASPAPGAVSASPAFAGGTGTQADPYQLTAAAVPFSGSTATSAQTVTVTGGAGDFLIVTDNSPTASGDRFANQSVGNLDAAGNIDIQFTYNDAPGTTIDNVTYVGQFQLGTTHFVWNVVQSALAPLTQDSAATISGTVSVGSVLTCNPGSVTGGTVTYQVTGYQWQKSFDGVSNFFNITGATSSTYTPAGTDSNTFLRCIASHADSTDPLQGGPLTLDLTTSATTQVPASAAPVISNVTLTEDDATGDRFTDQTFSVAVDMLNDGAPVSQKGIKATVTADVNTFRDMTVSSSSFNDSTSNTIAVDFVAANDSIWGNYNSSSSNYYQWWCNGMIAYVAPGTSNLKVGFHQSMYNGQYGYYNGHLSETNITNATSTINGENNWSFVAYQGGNNNSTYANWGYQIQWRDAPLAPDGTTPIVWGSGHGSGSYYIGGCYKVGTFNQISTWYTQWNQMVIDKNYRVWGRYSNQNWNSSSFTYNNSFVLSDPGPWSTVPPRHSSYKSETYGFVAIDSSGKYVVDGQGAQNIAIKVIDVDVSNNANPDSSELVHNITVTAPGALQDRNWHNSTVNALYYKDLEVILVGSYSGVMRIDINNQVAADVTPGVTNSGHSNFVSNDGMIEDRRTPATPHGAAFYAYDPDDNRRPARWETVDAGLNWTKVYYNQSIDYVNSSTYYEPNYMNPQYARHFLDHQFANVQKNYSSAGNRPKAWFGSEKNISQTLTLDASTEVQYGVLYFPVNGPKNLASAIMMRSSGTQSTVSVGASYEVQPNTVYESKTSTGSNTVSRFMVISSSGLVENTSSSDPGFVQIGPGTDIDLTFPSALPSGSSPDDEFPAGATIQVEVEATNSVASDTYPSATITHA